MKIVSYDDIDPMSALNLSLLALNFALTPERAAHIRQTDPRPFPRLAIYAVEDDLVLGQVGIFRLPMISIEGREDVGGVWAVSTHPQYAGRGIASLLLDEAHDCMRQAGLRFSTLATGRSRLSYRLYQRHGYVDMNTWATAIARWEAVYQPTRYSSQPLKEPEFELVERLFDEIAPDYLGFAWRHRPFAPLRDKVNPQDIWILVQNRQQIGYAFVHQDKSVLKISNLVLRLGIDAAEAVAAIIANVKTPYIEVTVSRAVDAASLNRAGFQVARPNWGAFMLKPLSPDVDLTEARRLFGFDSDRFLISWLDTT